MTEQATYDLDQIAIMHAIMMEVTKQYPGIPGKPRYMNAAIEAANIVVAEFSRADVIAATGSGLLDWSKSDRVGLSSKYMAHTLAKAAGMEVPLWGQPENNYPRDGADLGRCIHMLACVPELRPHIHEMTHHGKEWAAVIKHWDEWVAMYDADMGKELYRAMKEAFRD